MHIFIHLEKNSNERIEFDLQWKETCDSLAL